MIDLAADIIGEISLMDIVFCIATLIIGVIGIKIAVSIFK